MNLDPTLTAYGPWGIVAALVLAFVTHWLRTRSATPSAPANPSTPATPATPSVPASHPVLDSLMERWRRLEELLLGRGQIPPNPPTP